MSRKNRGTNKHISHPVTEPLTAEQAENLAPFAPAEHPEEQTGITLVDGELATNANSAPDFGAVDQEPIDPTEDTDTLDQEPMVAIQYTECAEQSTEGLVAEEPMVVELVSEPTGPVIVVDASLPEVIEAMDRDPEFLAKVKAMIGDPPVVVETEAPQAEVSATTESAPVTEAPQAEVSATQGEPQAAVEENPKPKGGKVLKRWAAGTVKDGRSVLFSKNVKDIPDIAEFVLHRKDNPKRQDPHKRFNTILLGRCKTVGAYRKAWGSKQANADLAWDQNHGFYSLRVPNLESEVEEGQTVAA